MEQEVAFLILPILVLRGILQTAVTETRPCQYGFWLT